ncbi:MAG: primosomal protein N', partial [Syntrophothermus sp.]
PAQALDRSFHYRIGEGLAGRVQVGSRVLVPFARRRVEGFVVGKMDTPGVPLEEIREILAVVDVEPLLTGAMVELARWIAGFYCCSLLDAIRAMLPTGIEIQGTEVWLAAGTGGDGQAGGTGGSGALALDELRRAAPRQAEVLEFLSSAGRPLDRQELVERFGVRVGGILQALAGKGLATARPVWRSPKVRPRLAQVVKLNGPVGAGAPADLREKTLVEVARRSKAQARVLEVLLSNTQAALTAAEIARLAGVDPGAIRSLRDKGLVTLELVERRRDPFKAHEPGSILYAAKAGPVVLTKAQEEALEGIRAGLQAGKHQVILLHGVTGSGKTEVYLRAMSEALLLGRRALVLVPEIALTPQMAQAFYQRFGDAVAVLHSRLSAGERFDEWRRAREGSVRIVVGARSAVFAPLENIGLIVVDEEHETSYKQEETPRYHLREVAIARGGLEQAVVVLGSATPSLETFFQAQSGKIRYFALPERIGARPLPRVAVVDMREELKQGNRTIFSRLLQKGVQERLARREQVILFLNRRGYASFYLCRECGHVIRCKDCQVSLTYHAEAGRLQCHYCGYSQEIPKQCPVCQSRFIRHFGIGTERVAQEAEAAFSGARVLRMDADTTARKGAHGRLLGAFARGEYDILVGTQMVAKGLDIPGVTLVGVVTADTALNLPDFRAAERTFQLLTQVAGRAGRGDAGGAVVIQTYSPEHFSIQSAAAHDYRGFYEQEIIYRRQLGYPPYTELILITFSGVDEREVIRAAERFRLELGRPGFEVIGPMPAPLAKLRGKFRHQFIAKGGDLAAIREAVMGGLRRLAVHQEGAGVFATIDVQPMSLL